MSGPFTQFNGSWGNSAIDRVQCEPIFACIKKYPHIIIELLSRSQPVLLNGIGSPEGIVFAVGGSIYIDRSIPLEPQQYTKGTKEYGNTGWVG